MAPSAQSIQENYICTSPDTLGCMQMKQGILINSVPSPPPAPPPATKWSVNYCTISGTWHLNKYLITLEQNTCMFDKKNPSTFSVNADDIYHAIIKHSSAGSGALSPTCCRRAGAAPSIQTYQPRRLYIQLFFLISDGDSALVWTRSGRLTAEPHGPLKGFNRTGSTGLWVVRVHGGSREERLHLKDPTKENGFWTCCCGIDVLNSSHLCFITLGQEW